jgi:uncharacterized protein YndB with AHSA1/START domain
MTQLELSILIDQPIEKVFALVDQPADYPRWQSGVIDAGEDSDRITGVGATGWQIRKVFGRDARMTFEVTEYKVNKRKAFKSTSGPVKVEGAYLFEPVGEGTRFTIKFASEPQGLLKLVKPLSNRAVTRQWKASLENLKELLESE